MIKKRIIPTLLYKNFTLVKSVGFDSWRRVASIPQAIKVFNLRGVDELVFLDITATNRGESPDFNLIDDFADYCFMPLTVGGGIKSIEDIKGLLRVGADKVVINTEAVINSDLIYTAAGSFGSQCIVVSIDVKRGSSGEYFVYTNSGTIKTQIDPVSHAKSMELLGAGEILLTSIDQDGVMNGYDIELIASASEVLNIPFVACGGAGSIQHISDAVNIGKARAVAAGSMFVFHGPHRAVLINYPDQKTLESIFYHE